MSETPQKNTPKQRTKRATNTAHHSRKPSKHVKAATGLEARSVALELTSAVLHRGQSLDEALTRVYSEDTHGKTRISDPRDRGFARLLATTVLRRHGQLEAIVSGHLAKPLPSSGRHAHLILLQGAAQLLFLGAAPHAVINTAVELSRQQRSSARFAGLINAVLRRIAENGQKALETSNADSLNIPDWMFKRWSAAYGENTAHAIASASLNEPTLDITVRDHPQDWAKKLDGIILSTGTIRRKTDGRIEALPGFADGQWWIQDTAAALPAHLLGNVTGKRVADLCAAPGGKTAQLASAGAQVLALDISEMRLLRVRENFQRLGLESELVAGDAATWRTDRPFDAVLIDAPCSVTGTIRRHPDILHLKRPEDIAKLSKLQSAILDNAATHLLRPDGMLVYCTCSMEPEEGEEQIDNFLSRHAGFERVPIHASEMGNLSECITPSGDVRTMPHQLHLEETPELSGLDGFFISRLRRKS